MAYARRYDFFRGFYRRPITGNRNRVHIPFLIALIMSDISRKMQTLFGGSPYVDFEGHDPVICRKNAKLTTLQWDDLGIYSVMADFFLCADMYGLGGIRHGWKTLRRKERWRDVVDDGFSKQEQTFEGMVTRFDGPDVKNIDPLDLWTQPGRKTIPSSDYVMVHYTMSLREVEMEGVLDRFDKAQVEKLKTMGPASSPHMDEAYKTMRASVYRSPADYEARRNDQYDRMVDCVDMVGYVPNEFGIGGVTFTITTIADDAVVLRHREFPYFHGQFNILTYSPLPDPHVMHGPGKIEIVERLGYLINKIASAKADILDRAIDNQWLVNRLSGIDEDSIYSRPGKVIGIDGPVGPDQIQPLVPDLRGFAAGGMEIENYFRFTQQAMGLAEDISLGMDRGGSDRQTAHEFAGRRDAVMTRQTFEALLAEKGVVVPLADATRWLNRQFLKLPAQLRMLGDEAILDPITGAKIPPEIDAADLRGDFRARAVGAMSMLQKSTRQANLIPFLQILSNMPGALQAINWMSLLRESLDLMDFKARDLLTKQLPAGITDLADQTGQDPQTMALMMANGYTGSGPALAAAFGGAQ